jgi:hypothetical protein
MKRVMKKTGKQPERETLTEAYEVRAFRDESEEPASVEATLAEVPHAAPGAIQAIKSMVQGHGEQSVLPDDCQFGDNDLCFVDA